MTDREKTELMQDASDDAVFEEFFRAFIAEGMDEETAREAAEEVCGMRRGGWV